LGRGNPELDAAAAPFVAVRVTDLRDVDVANLRFDFDLTFAVLLMHADGTVYHRFGSRDAGPADRWSSLATMAQLLRDTLPEHRAYDGAPSPPPRAKPMRAIDLPVLQQKLASGQQIDCVHCHTVNDAESRDAMLGKRWRRDDAYVFPDPARVGLTLDPLRQAKVTAVAAGSPAAAAGVAAGDELLALGVQPSVRTLGDVQWALHRAPFAANELPVRFRRDGAERTAALVVADGWKCCPPEDYAWRPLKWNLSPSPGFGGPVLDAAEKRRRGLPDDTTFAMRVQYLVDWGEHAARGRGAHAAGLRKGDVVLAFGGKRDFHGFDHLHAWCALTLTAGADTPIVVWRDGAEHTLRYRLPE
jgi:serine protease Do